MVEKKLSISELITIDFDETAISYPTVQTSEVSDITDTSAVCGGDVTSDGNVPVTVRGVCWSTSQNPTIADSYTTDGSGTGRFTSSLTGLSQGTTYYVRAYATNEVGIMYGEEKMFKTIGLPVVTTNEVKDVTDRSALCGGNVISDGGKDVTARGICWSTLPNPTIVDSLSIDGIGEGSFDRKLLNLEEQTTYYVRAYATNSMGTSYGAQVEFKTDFLNCGIVTDYDGNSYKTIQIGEQCWMRENLKTTRYADGTSIEQGNSSSLSQTVAYWWGTREPKTGLFYNWKAVMRNSSSSNANPSGVQGICPNGWHMPSDAEWTQLIDYVGSQSQYLCDTFKTQIAKALASTSFRHTSSRPCAIGNDPDRNNATGFDALPVGKFDYYWFDGYVGESRSVDFWSSTGSGDYASYRGLLYSEAHVSQNTHPKKFYGCSVRCVKGTVLPTVTTSVVSNIDYFTATCGGDVSDGGGPAVTARGVCWSTMRYPTIADNHTTDGDGTGAFTSNLTDLSAVTTYFVRAYAINSAGVAYGEEMMFETVGLPIVFTKDARNIADLSATCGGEVSSNGADTVTAHGVCWSTSSNPTIADSHTVDGAEIGGFTSFLTGLTAATTYYVRAYATNKFGTNYGQEVSFTTLNPSCADTPTVTDVDGNSYNTVQIGTQCWMRENLKTTKYADGSTISLYDGYGSSSLSKPFRYYPNNDLTNVSDYGYLYNLKAVMRKSSSSSANPSGVQGICPTGWHVPSDAEWTQLTDYVSSQSQYLCNGNKTNIAKALASSTGWMTDDNSCTVGNDASGALNSTCFDAMPAAYYEYDSFKDSFYNVGRGAYFWSATAFGVYGDTFYYRRLLRTRTDVYRANSLNGHAFAYSVRCLRD
jgi:uncharacterized protein (TIGR02145 family)